MKRHAGFRDKLRRSSGESVVETLAAVLICTLAAFMLYTAVASAARLNVLADERSAALREGAVLVEQQLPSGDYREVTVDGLEGSYAVEYFEDEASGYCTYRLRPAQYPV